MKNDLFKNEELTDLATYFSYFDERMYKYCTDEKVKEYYVEVKESIQTVAQGVSGRNLMQSMKQLLVLDAKLQILFFFIGNSTFTWTGREIIDMAENDSKSYYEETFGLSTMSELSHSMLFMKSA